MFIQVYKCSTTIQYIFNKTDNNGYNCFSDKAIKYFVIDIPKSCNNGTYLNYKKDIKIEGCWDKKKTIAIKYFDGSVDKSLIEAYFKDCNMVYENPMIVFIDTNNTDCITPNVEVNITVAGMIVGDKEPLLSGVLDKLSKGKCSDGDCGECPFCNVSDTFQCCRPPFQLCDCLLGTKGFPAPLGQLEQNHDLQTIFYNFSVECLYEHVNRSYFPDFNHVFMSVDILPCVAGHNSVTIGLCGSKINLFDTKSIDYKKLEEMICEKNNAFNTPVLIDLDLECLSEKNNFSISMANSIYRPYGKINLGLVRLPVDSDRNPCDTCNIAVHDCSNTTRDENPNTSTSGDDDGWDPWKIVIFIVGLSVVSVCSIVSCYRCIMSRMVGRNYKNMPDTESEMA